MKKTYTHDALFMSAASVAIAAAWILFNWQALWSLNARWMHLDEASAVGYPAVLLSLWWVIRHRQTIAAFRQRTASGVALALVLLVGVLLVGVAAQLVQLQLLQQLAALASLWLIVTALLGWQVGRQLLFPAVLLLVAIPLWDFLVNPLRELTVLFSQHMLDWLAIPAHVDGFRVILPSGIVTIAGGCSGLSLFLAMVLVGLMFVDSPKLALWRRASIVAVAAIIGLIDNWIRVFLLIVIAYRTEMQSQLVYHHGNFGWWIFVVSLLPYFWLATRIERGGKRTEQVIPRPLSAFSESLAGGAGVAVLLVSLMVAAWWGGSHFADRRGLAVQGLTPPAMAVTGTPTWLPNYSGQDLTQTWYVSEGARAYEITALTYLEQRADKKLIYFDNRIAAEGRVINTGKIAVAADFSVNTAVLNGRGVRYVWWFWWVDGSTSVNPLVTKLLQLKATLLGDPSAAFVALSVVCDVAPCAAHVPAMDAALRQVLMSLRHLHAAK